MGHELTLETVIETDVHARIAYKLKVSLQEDEKKDGEQDCLFPRVEERDNCESRQGHLETRRWNDMQSNTRSIQRSDSHEMLLWSTVSLT